MVGVELIVPVQLVYLLHWLTEDYTLPLSLFQYFSSSFGNFWFYFNRRHNLQLSTYFQRMDFDPAKFEVTVVATVGCMFLLLAVKALTLCLSSGSRIVDRVLFAWTTGFALVLLTLSVDHIGKAQSESLL